MALATTEWPRLGAASAWQGDLAPLLDEAARGSFDPLAARLAQTRGHWDERAFLLECVVHGRLPEPALGAWYAPRAGQAGAELLFGAANLAWARSSAAADRQAKLIAAEQSFLRAFPLDPADPTPGIFLLRASVPLRRPQDALGRVFAQSNQRDPANLPLHLAYLDSLLGEGGDASAALGWASEVSAQCPPGLELHMLVVQALVRTWEAAYFTDPVARTGANIERAEHVLTPAARTEVVAVCERSLQHPSFVSQRSSLYLRNLAAFWYFLVADRERLAAELQRIGPSYTPDPWAARGAGDARRGYSRAIDVARGRGLSGLLLLVGGPKNALRIAGGIAAAVLVFSLGSWIIERPAKIGQACKFDGDCSSGMCLGPIGKSYCSHECTTDSQCSNSTGAGSYSCAQSKETLHPTGQKPVDAIVHACVPQL